MSIDAGNSSTFMLVSESLVEPGDIGKAAARISEIARAFGMPYKDESDLNMAVAEIARNAIEYGEGAQLVARGSSRSIRVEIWDTGPGIPLETLESIESGTFKEGREHGINLARSLVDTLTLTSFPGNTQVIIEKRLNGTLHRG